MEKKNIIFSEKFFELRDSLDVPSTLRVFGVDENNIEVLLKEIEKLDKAFAQNPITFTVEDGKNLELKLIRT